MKNELKISILLITAFGLAYYFFTYLPEKELDKNHRYAIGRVMRIENTDGDPGAVVYFYFDSISYTAGFSLDSDYIKEKFYYAIDPEYTHASIDTILEKKKSKNWDLVIVKFSPSNPNNSEVKFCSRIPDSLIDPFKSWKIVPKGLKVEKL